MKIAQTVLSVLSVLQIRSVDAPSFVRFFKCVVASVTLCITICMVGCDGASPSPKQMQHQLQTTADKPAFEQVVISDTTYILQLALDDDGRFQGLSDVKEIPTDGGMLFVFAQPRELNFVMRKCLVPIDLVYLGPGGRIVSMHKMQMVPYDTPEAELVYYNSGWPAQFVIELKQGSIERLKFKIGQKIDLPLVSLKAMAS